jgi:predicted  nucleic acid-binding Zn-ribbon protein
MKEDHKRLEIEKLRIIEKETQLLKDTGSWKEETNAIRKELKDIKKDRETISDEVDQKISNKLAGIDGNKRKTPAGHWIVELPYPVMESMDYQRELDGDEEYWL